MGTTREDIGQEDCWRLKMENRTIRIVSDSEEETKAVGKWIGGLVRTGDIVCLEGDLGTGKTKLTKGIAEALGIDEMITSPTFTIVNEYVGAKMLYHFDVYRVNDPEELYDIGFEEYIYNRAVVVIEWADLIKEMIPLENIWIRIKKKPDERNNTRIIEVSFNGDSYAKKEFTGSF